TTMLDPLNDDCQLGIIKYLNLTDQIALYEATKGVSSRLNSNVAYAWKHQLCFTLDANNYEDFEEMPEMLHIFLSNISETVQKLHLKFVTMEFLQRWENFTFPNMRTLKYTLDDGDCDKNDDQVIEIMAKLFPGLRSLKPHGGFNCELLPNWRQLRKLDLSDWWEGHKGFDCPKEIAKCQLLEELILYKHFLWFEMYDVIMALPKLRTFSFNPNGRDDILAELLDRRGKDVHKMIFNDCIWEYSMPTLHKMCNLHHLTLLEDDGFTSEKLRELIADLKQLEQIDLIDFQIWSGEAELWQTVASCPSLRILNISGMQLYEDFFQFGRRVMVDTMNNRPQPLTLHCHNTGENE
ncbi:hypothetical protein KR044_002025, partial [Drosophila immigrans]